MYRSHLHFNSIVYLNDTIITLVQLVSTHISNFNDQLQAPVQGLNLIILHTEIYMLNMLVV